MKSLLWRLPWSESARERPRWCWSRDPLVSAKPPWSVKFTSPSPKKMASSSPASLTQLRHNIPYSALIQALRGLIREVSFEDKSGMERWKSRIRAALGPNGQLMTRVIPELEQMIGPQPPLPEIGALETRNRFTAVLLAFISVFCEKTHPLVIFLDDLQWVRRRYPQAG